MLQNEEVCGNTIYSSSEASGVSHIIHRSRRLRWIMICFARVENTVLLCTYELCNCISYQVENCENNSKNCENDIIFTENCEVIRQKTQNNTFYLIGITPSRGN